ncbi:efflux RND transporter periplasmic adaptor subunit [Actinocorallia sp. B10E7]|uniref:HlyD family secretion protein n=1 Tax=Actinocorallia sp. B10E7 TaxID=3153558 RepID=UPI00325CC344
MKLKRKKAAVAGGVLSLVLTGAGLAACSGGDGAGSAPAAAAPSASATAVQVSTGDSVSASGTVQSARVRELAFATGGVITKLNVKAGDKVVKGDLLGAVDSTAARENLSAAYTAYVAAQDDYEDVKSGKDVTAPEDEDSKTSDANSGQGQGTQGSGNGSQGRTEAAQTTAEAYAALVEAKNTYTKAQREVAGTKVYAPFAGTITALSGTVDAEVQSGTTVFTLTDGAHLRISAEFSEADTPRLKKGQKATVVFDSLGEKVNGKIISVSPTPVSSSDTAAAGPGGGFQASSTSVVRYQVLVSLNRTPAKTRVGAPVTVEVKTG